MKRGVALVLSLVLCAAFVPTAFADQEAQPLSTPPATAQQPPVIAGKILVMAPHNGDPAATIDRIRTTAAPYDVQYEKVITEDGVADTVIITLTIADDAQVDTLIGELTTEPGVIAEREHLYTLTDTETPNPFSGGSEINPATTAPATVDDPDLKPHGELIPLDSLDAETLSKSDPLALPDTSAPDAPSTETTPAPAATLPNDTVLNSQPELFSYYDRYGANVVNAWQYLGGRDNNTTIAVIDTIWNNAHVELNDNILTDLAGTAAYGEMRVGKVIVDNVSTHSTSVCGIASAVTNNNYGMSGAAYNAKLLPIQVLLEDGAPDSWVVTALQYIDDLIESGNDHNLHVINMSFGAYNSSFDSVGTRLIDHLTRAHNVLCVCSGGNGDDYGNAKTQAMYPSDLTSTLSVTALGTDGADCSWSDYNLHKDITAPGQNLYRPYHTSNYSVGPGFSGTSGSAPLVSGIASIIYSVVPGITPDQVKSCLQATAISLAGTKHYHGSRTGSPGAVDAAAAVQMAIDRYGGGAGDGQTVNIPVGQTSVYDGNYHQGVADSYAYQVIGGINRAVDAGEYAVAVIPNDGWTWPDGTTDQKIVLWRIDKATGKLSPRYPSASLKRSDTDGIDIPLDYVGDGDLWAASGDYNVVFPSIISRGSDGNVSRYLHLDPWGVGTTWVTITAEDGRNYTDPPAVTVSVQVTADENVGNEVPVYRAYNQWTTEHLLTQSLSEFSGLTRAGWQSEGVAWYAPSYSSNPIYRLYNPYNGDHMYTSSWPEYLGLQRNGWRGEGTNMYSATSNGAPVYRLYNPWMTANGGAYSHLWTANYNEYITLGDYWHGWSREGTAWYASTPA